MLQKIITIENVGRFKNAPATGDSQFTKYTTIVGANGYGKTTLCAILRSLQTGVAAHILGRKTLGATKAPAINLLLASGNSRFTGDAWTSTLPSLAIFDGVFVAENVHSGEVVETDHKRNLYRVIIGQQGVVLAEEDARLAAESRTKTADASTAAKAIQPHVPTGMKLEQFIALPADVDIDTKIADQARTVEAVQQADRLKTRSVLSEIQLPSLPLDFEEILARTLDDVAADAEAVVARHVAHHGLEDEGTTWIANGLSHAGDTCPFCGQGIKGLPLIAAYRAIFSDQYDALKNSLVTMHSTVTRLFGDGGAAQLATLDAQNTAATEFWGQYCTLDAAALALPVAAAPAVTQLGQAALRLLELKIQKPLEALALDRPLKKAKADYEAAVAATKTAQEAVTRANTIIAARKAEATKTDLKTAQAELSRLRAIKARHTTSVAALCAEHSRHSADKVNLDTQKDAIRTRLDAHTKSVVKPYEKLINKYLDDFNAGFRIAQTKHNYAGGVATSSYQLVIESHHIDVGDSKTPIARPSFKNTLSAGDRTTLALAFFLASLTKDAALDQKVVVFDDPFNSQDAFRRLQTVHEIMKVGGASAQIIVLSHDATFLRQVWAKAPPAARSSLQIYDAGLRGSRISPIDLDKACQGRTATDIDDLLTYLTTGAGQPLDIIRKMRTVLETYCRSTYVGAFLPDDYLGEIVGKIRNGGTTHPAEPLYTDLDQINDYSAPYHHGADARDATPDEIDATALKGYARRTLKIINALQA